MTDSNVMSNEDFYRDTATIAMAAYNESGTDAADKIVSNMIAGRFEDSYEREWAATQVAKIIAADFEVMMDEMDNITEQEELPLADEVEPCPELVEAIPNAE
tara:strand:+ start:1974 stop:2279 length:306 start_codon:yes stop_codon:yes gene_type:complete